MQAFEDELDGGCDTGRTATAIELINSLTQSTHLRELVDIFHGWHIITHLHTQTALEASDQLFKVTLIKVFAEVRKKVPTKLVMVGDGPEKPGAEQLARELGLQRDVLFLGNQDCMEELLPLADAFLLPSSSESFGLVALEAMSAEVPVVASNIGGLPEVVEHGVTGFLHDPRSIDGFVSSILRLFSNERLRRAMGRRARREARERFNVDDMVDRYVRVYDSFR